jgi:hypothetical protein
MLECARRVAKRKLIFAVRQARLMFALAMSTIRSTDQRDKKIKNVLNLLTFYITALVHTPLPLEVAAG